MFLIGRDIQLTGVTLSPLLNQSSSLTSISHLETIPYAFEACFASQQCRRAKGWHALKQEGIKMLSCYVKKCYLFQ